MRKIHTTALALLGVALGAGSLTFAVAADPPSTPDLAYRAVMPGVAGDDVSHDPANGGGTLPTSTATKTTTATPSATAQPLGCAGLRTPVKVLGDGGAGFVREPEAGTVFGLLAAPRPDGITNATSRFVPFEARVVEVTATLVGFRRTPGGGIDLTISQVGGGPTMLASFPGLSCMTGTADDDKGLIGAARNALQFECGNPPDSGAFKPLGGKAKLRGVPFWGTKRTDQYAGAVSGIELGPVLGFEFDDATSCDANAAQTPRPTKTPTPVLQEILINVIPNPGIKRGSTIQINVITVPAIAGRICHWEMWDANDQTHAVGEVKVTEADGWARWTFDVPLDMPLGQARVAPRCVDAVTDGSARLQVTD